MTVDLDSTTDTVSLDSIHKRIDTLDDKLDSVIAILDSGMQALQQAQAFLPMLTGLTKR